MAVAFDAAGTADAVAHDTSPVNFTNLTVGSGSERALVAFISIDISVSGSDAISSVQWDATGTPQAMTLITSITNGNSARTFLYGLVNPTSGAKTLRVTFSGTAPDEVFLDAFSVTGADQTGGTTTFAHANTATGTSTSPSVSITSATGNLTAAGITAPQVLSSPTQTQIFADNAGLFTSGGASRAAGAGSVSHGWTLAGSVAWAMAGVDIVASGGGGGGATGMGGGLKFNRGLRPRPFGPGLGR